MSREWTNIDKSQWGDGPWQSEPDKIQWVDPATDLDCLMVRQEQSGHWCGYVGVAEGHPAFEVGYSDLYDRGVDINVHGGLTFADACDESAAEGHGICHIPEPGRPDHIWWLGFDCHHGHDLAPLFAIRERERGWAPDYADMTYRDRAYVEREVASLARQLAAIK